MRVLVKLLAVVSGALFLGSYLGAVHPAGDSLAVGRIVWAVIFALAVIWSDMATRARWVISAAPLLGLAHLAALTMITGPAGPITVYTKNMRFHPAERAELVADIRASGAELVFLQEVSESNAEVLEALADVLPHRLVCPFTSWASVAVMSRWPVAGEGVCAPGIAALPVTGPEGPVWALSLHLHWPWPYRQAAHLDDLAPALEGLDGPVIAGGDFNMVPWGWSVRRVGALIGSVRAGAVRATVVKRGVPLPIDMILAPHGGRVEERPYFGSDHKGVVGQVWLEPPSR